MGTLKRQSILLDTPSCLGSRKYCNKYLFPRTIKSLNITEMFFDILRKPSQRETQLYADRSQQKLTFNLEFYHGLPVNIHQAFPGA